MWTRRVITPLRRFNSTLVIAEHSKDAIHPSTLNTLTAAHAIQHPITLLLTGTTSDAVVQQASRLAHVSQVLVANHTVFDHGLADVMEPLVVQLHKQHNFSHVLTGHSAFGKNVLPRIAAVLDCGQVSDIVGVEGVDTFTRPIYAGNALATVKSNDKVKFITVRSTAFPAAGAQDTPANVQIVDVDVPAGSMTWESEQVAVNDRPDLGNAKRVVSGGRALGSADNFSLLYTLADKLGAAVGASRAAVDAGYVDNSLQVGQTGKIVAPELYIAIGISGAIQHVAGIKDSKVIVAINKDADAPIFALADYGLVGDLFKIIPELTEKV
jgi:electron transfer flavoprotein alpha subunit